MLNFEKFVQKYIQFVVLERSFESISQILKEKLWWAAKVEKIVKEAVDRFFSAESVNADVTDAMVAGINRVISTDSKMKIPKI